MPAVPVAVDSVDSWNPCVVSAAQSVGASALLDPIAIGFGESCFSGASFAARVMADVATDATLTAAFNAVCLASSFESSGTLATFACLDAELTSSGLGSQLLAGTADSDAVGIATIGCLTNDEAAALLS